MMCVLEGVTFSGLLNSLEYGLHITQININIQKYSKFSMVHKILNKEQSMWY